MVREGGKCMRCNNKGQAALWEVVLLLALMLGVFIWIQYKKPSESNKFQDQAKQYQYTYSPGGIRLFDFSCSRKGLLDESFNRQINSSR
jgi:hypothetical protein